MKRTVSDDEALRLYLLGQLEEDALGRIEERILLEQEYGDEVLAAEDALTDDYVRGKLSSQQRTRFEQHFLAAPERAEKLRLARSLNRYISEQTATAPATVREQRSGALQSALAFLGFQRPLLGMALMAATLLFAVGGGWLILQTQRLQSEIQQAHSEQARLEKESRLERQKQQADSDQLAGKLQQEQAQRAELEQEVASLKQHQASGPEVAANIITASLLPGLLRDVDQVKSIGLPPGATQVRLRLGLDAAQSQGFKGTYSAELQDSEGKQIWKRTHLAPAGKSIVVAIPATIFKQGQYRLVLDAQTDQTTSERAGTYYFRVSK